MATRSLWFRDSIYPYPLPSGPRIPSKHSSVDGLRYLKIPTGRPSMRQRWTKVLRCEALTRRVSFGHVLLPGFSVRQDGSWRGRRKRDGVSMQLIRSLRRPKALQAGISMPGTRHTVSIQMAYSCIAVGRLAAGKDAIGWRLEKTHIDYHLLIPPIAFPFGRETAIINDLAPFVRTDLKGFLLAASIGCATTLHGIAERSNDNVLTMIYRHTADQNGPDAGILFLAFVRTGKPFAFAVGQPMQEQRNLGYLHLLQRDLSDLRNSVPLHRSRPTARFFGPEGMYLLDDYHFPNRLCAPMLTDSI